MSLVQRGGGGSRTWDNVPSLCLYFFWSLPLCSFYSPPHARSKLKNELADHIVGTLSMLTVKHENSAIFVCGDRNNFDITPLLNNSLKLKQIVSLPTRKNKILDICITNMSKYYNTPSIVSPVEPDDLNNGVPSDHSVPFCVPHTDPSKPPKRQWEKVASVHCLSLK